MAANVQKLASFPEVALRIDEVLADDTSSAADIGALIEPDPALSAALLRIANSAAYSAGGAVDNAETAVRIVGSREVRDLTYAISSVKSFEGVPNELISVEDFWKHSLYCASAAQQIAKSAKICHGVSLFTAGLLHDIGQLVMFNQCPDLSRQALQLSLDSDDGRSVCHAERNVFGYDHTDVGAALAQCWQFPETLRAAIAHHHAPFESEDYSDVAMVVHVANSIAVLAELESRNFADAPAIDERAAAEIGLSSDVLLEAVDAAKESGLDLLQLFMN